MTNYYIEAATFINEHSRSETAEILKECNVGFGLNRFRLDSNCIRLLCNTFKSISVVRSRFLYEDTRLVFRTNIFLYDIWGRQCEFSNPDEEQTRLNSLFDETIKKLRREKHVFLKLFCLTEELPPDLEREIGLYLGEESFTPKFTLTYRGVERRTKDSYW
jgi:hypothetical protein